MTKQETIDALTRGEGCLGRSKDDEPVFVLVARDKLSSGVVRMWAADAIAAGVDSHDEKIESALRWADDADRWRAKNGGKVPD